MAHIVGAKRKRTPKAKTAAPPARPSPFPDIYDQGQNIPADIDKLCDSILELSESAMANSQFGVPYAHGMRGKSSMLGVV